MGHNFSKFVNSRKAPETCPPTERTFSVPKDTVCEVCDVILSGDVSYVRRGLSGVYLCCSHDCQDIYFGHGK